MRVTTIIRRLPFMLGAFTFPAVLHAQTAEQRQDLIASETARGGQKASGNLATVVAVPPQRAAAILKSEATRLGWISVRSDAGSEQWIATTDSGTVQVRVRYEAGSGGTRLTPEGDERGRILARKLFLLARRSGLQ